MALIKRCSCGWINDSNEAICRKCENDILFETPAYMPDDEYKRIMARQNGADDSSAAAPPHDEVPAAFPGKYLISLDNMCVVQPESSGQKSVLGRSSSDIKVREYLESRMGVSRNHAHIWHDGKNLFIEDQGSTNGTFIDNKRIEPRRAYELKRGFQVTLGRPGSDKDKIAIFRIE